MREKLTLIAAGAACALGGVAITGGIAGAQKASTSSDAQIVRELRKVTTEIRSLRGTSSGSPRTIASIESAVEATCRNTATLAGGSAIGC